MTNTITIRFLSELRGYFCSFRYINNENRMYESACCYRQAQCLRESSYLILSIIFGVPHMYNITFATRKSKASHFSINVPFCSFRSNSKIGKNIGTLAQLSTYKNNRYFQLKLCIITLKIVLSNLI